MDSDNLDVLTKMTLLLTHLSRPLLPAWNHVPFNKETLTPRRSLKPFPETISQTGRTKT